MEIESSHWFSKVLKLVVTLGALYIFAAAAGIGADIPRPEHPTPQFLRDAWLNLNGPWSFAFDLDNKGLDEHWEKSPTKFDKTILVPFCPESKLSGIGYTGFITGEWYRRTFTVPPEWKGSHVFLHFGAVYYEAQVWVNGEEVGHHYGGSVSFALEVTPTLHSGENEVVVYVHSDVRSSLQPSGKQSPRGESFGVMYTRTTGIWQTVWLEARPQRYLRSVRIVPDLDSRRFVLTPEIEGDGRDLTFRATLLGASGEELAAVQAANAQGLPQSLTVDQPHVWAPGDPYLYGLRFELLEGSTVVDRVSSYAGLRKFHIEGNRLYLNNRPIFLRFVLDQGFYPDGIWTAPTDTALKGDISRSMAAGFTGARLHQKVFEERFHYWADRLGYLTWAEFPDWGGVHDFGNPQGVLNLEREWRDAVLRDRNYPSILAWTPLNETSDGASKNPEPYRTSVRSLYATTHALDSTRPVNTTSGYVQVITDLFTAHDYTQNGDFFRKRYSVIAPDAGKAAYTEYPNLSATYQGQPYLVDEYGGTFWTKDYESQPEKAGKGRNSWGYGKSARQVEDEIKALTDVLLEQPNISGFVYTQLTDVEQEVNGIYTYDRKPKFDLNRLKSIFDAPAAIESR